MTERGVISRFEEFAGRFGRVGGFLIRPAPPRGRTPYYYVISEEIHGKKEKKQVSCRVVLA